MKRKTLIIGYFAVALIALGVIVFTTKGDFMPVNSTDANEGVVKPLKEVVGNVTISVDPRLELLASVEINSMLNNLVEFKSEYRTDMENYFKSMKKHEAVDTFETVSMKGIYIDAPPRLMLHLSEVPHFNISKTIDDELISHYTRDRETTDKLINEFRDYAKKSNFEKFFEEHEDFYKEQIKNVKEMIEKRNYVKDIEDYYGMKQSSYNIILSPLFRGNFGPRLPREDGTYDLYAILGSHNVARKITEDSLRYLMWHEFSHSFINPITLENMSLVEKYEDNYSSIESDMKKQGYSNWTISTYEHIIRAVTARLSTNIYGEEVGQEMMERERSRGFIYIEALCDKLEYYEDNRDKYSTIEEFFPELMEAFGEEV